MFKEVLKGYYLCKIKGANAHYLVTKGVYDHVQKHCVYNTNMKLDIDHLLGGTRYQTEFHKIQLLNWEDLPKNYQLDALALHEGIRKEYGSLFPHIAQQGAMKDIRAQMLRAVDSVTKGVREYTIAANVVTGEGIPVILLQETQQSQNRAWQTHKNSHLLQNRDNSPAQILDFSGSASKNACQEIALPIQGHPYPDKPNPNNTTKQNTMSNLLSNIPGLNLNFGTIQKGLIALSMNGELAFKDKQGNYVTIQKEGTEKTRVDVGSLKFDIDFYQVPTQELEDGDVILLDNEFLIAGAKKNGDRSFINPITGATTNKLQRSNILGMYFYTKVVSLFDMAGGQAKGVGLGGLDPMMLMLMSGQGSTGGQDIGQLLVLSQLSQAKGGDTNSLLPLLMMSGGLGSNAGENGGIGQLLMLQALGGNKSGGLFGGLTKKAAKVPVRKKAPVKKAAIKKAVVKG